MERCSLPSDIVLLRRLNTCYVRYSVSRVDCFHSLKERERERERESSSSVFVWGFHFCAVKSQKKGEKWTDSRRPCCIERCHIHTIDYNIISRYRYRARRRDRAFHASPSESHDARTVFAEFRPSFSVGRLRVNTVRKAFSFLSALFFEIEKWHSNPKRFDDDTKMRASHPPFFGRRDRRDRRATRKNRRTPFHAR